ncbi:MAG: hypothetical protein HOH74_25450, partial [Gemmatimonadetes bacterium]|nr:hypothetical protein [Gemmatimonadota bacterium]
MDASRYIEDFDFLVDTVDRVHPCPDLTSTRHQLEAQRDRLRRDLAECRTDGDFWHVAQAYLVTVGDGHTNLRSPIKSDFRQAGLVTSLVDGQVVVAEVIDSESAPEVHVGDIILGVNGHDVETRLGEVIRSQPSDTVRSARFRAARDALVFVGSTSETCTVTLSAVNGSVYDTTLRLLGFSGPIADHDRQERVIDHKECVTTFFWEAASAGCLRLRSCMDRTTIQQEWLDCLDLTLDDVPDMESVCWDFFSALRASRARKAIIDIRGNGGGNSSVGATLLKYLTRKPIESYRGDTKVSEETKKWFPNEPIGSVARGTAGVRAFPYQTR